MLRESDLDSTESLSSSENSLKPGLSVLDGLIQISMACKTTNQILQNLLLDYSLRVLSINVINSDDVGNLLEVNLEKIDFAPAFMAKVKEARVILFDMPRGVVVDILGKGC